MTTSKKVVYSLGASWQGVLLTLDRLPGVQATHVSAWLSQPDVPAPSSVVSERSSRQHGLQSPDADAFLQVVSSQSSRLPSLSLHPLHSTALHSPDEG